MISHQTCQEELASIISCDDCGIVFENLHDLQKHIKTCCPEQNQLKGKQPEALSEEIEPSKKNKVRTITHYNEHFRGKLSS